MSLRVPTAALIGLATLVAGAAAPPASSTHEDAEPIAADANAPAADIRTASSSNFPSIARSVLALIERADREIQTFAFTAGGEFVVVAGNHPMYSQGFPTAPRTYVDQYVGTGREIDVVAFSKTGQWLIIAEDWLRRSNIPSAANSRIRSLQSAGKRIDAFAFSSVDTNGWMLVSDGRAYSGGTLPEGLEQAAAAARQAKRPIHEVAISHAGEWVLIADDWFATGGLASQRGFLRQMDEIRTDERRIIDHVVLTQVNGSLAWSILSNSDTRVFPSDIMTRIEYQLAPNQTVYQRMKAHDITGLSLAIVENNRVEWRRSYGIRTASGQEAVYPTTVFEAASISKPIAAFGALQLVDEGKVGLSDNGLLTQLNDRLFRSQTSTSRAGNASGPSSPFLDRFDDANEINLNRLLSHCAGVLHPPQVGNPSSRATGAQTISFGGTLPTLRQMLLGQSPASSNNAPTQASSLKPGARYRYSGANYLMVQAVIDQFSGTGFDRHMSDLFRHLQMNSTTYDTPTPAFGTDRLARGFSGAREQVIYAYPNKAAASLSTTADDLARFAIMLNEGGRNSKRQSLLRRGMVLALAGEQKGTNQQCADRNVSSARGTMGLGLMNTGNGTWHHGGTHSGYRAFLYARPGDRWAFVALMSGDSDDVRQFAAELFESVRARYQLPMGSLPL